MKNLLFFTISLILTVNLYSQDTLPKMELKHKGFVASDSTSTFVVIDYPDKSKNDLYTNALTYLNSIYGDPEKVLSTVENESIIVNGLTESIKGSLDWYKYPMFYKIIIQFKDEKIRVEPIITDLTEITGTGTINKYYVSNTDSPKEVEINCIWMKSKKTNDYFLFRDELKLSIDNWINSYVKNLVNGIENNDW